MRDAWAQVLPRQANYKHTWQLVLCGKIDMPRKGCDGELVVQGRYQMRGRAEDRRTQEEGGLGLRKQDSSCTVSPLRYLLLNRQTTNITITRLAKQPIKLDHPIVKT